MKIKQPKRRTASVKRHEVSRNVTGSGGGSESRLDRARFLRNAAVALDVPATAPYSEDASKKVTSRSAEEDWAQHPENKRHARALLHYAQD